MKTRLGIREPEEFFQILEIYEKFPLKELIIHPRVQKDFYKNMPRREMFRYAQEHSRHRLCYNGDLFTEKEICRFREEFPSCGGVMVGRGCLVNPALIRGMRRLDGATGDSANEAFGQQGIEKDPGLPTAEELFRFQELLVERYYRRMADDRNVLFKMKELWFYLIHLFEGGARYGKKLRKVQRISEYRLLMEQLFAECSLGQPRELEFAPSEEGFEGRRRKI